MLEPQGVLGFPEEAAPEAVPVNTLTGSMRLEREAEVARYRELFDAARTFALSPVDSLSVIRRRLKERRT
ncbi:repressor protein [Streptomyces sp. F-3]|nr:repressor protein [Streptomyces sp. F-3]